MSNENELKVGDVVSFKYNPTSWTTIKLLSLFDISTFQKNIINKRGEWQRGIHPSLIPEGFSLVKTGELEAARKEICRLQSVILEAANYHEVYVLKLKDSDPERSLRQQQRVDLLRSAIQATPKPEEG